MTWRLCWEHTAMLVEEAHGGADADIAEISRAEAEQITAGLAARHWPPDAVRAALGGLRLSAVTAHSTCRSRAGNAGPGTGRSVRRARPTESRIRARVRAPLALA